MVMPVKFWQIIIRFLFFLSHLITTVTRQDHFKPHLCANRCKINRQTWPFAFWAPGQLLFKQVFLSYVQVKIFFFVSEQGNFHWWIKPEFRKQPTLSSTYLVYNGLKPLLKEHSNFDRIAWYSPSWQQLSTILENKGL